MGHQALWSHRATFPPLTTSVAEARAFIEDLLIEHQLPHLVNDVRLVGSELATNATLHARTPFTVLLEGHERLVQLTVSDDSLLEPLLATAAPTATGGRGLGIVAVYSLDWGVTVESENTKSVWASFDASITHVQQDAGV